MAMAHLSSSEHLASKGFSGSPYMRNSSHMVGSSHSSLSLSSSEFASKYLMESSGYPSTECPAAAWQIGAGSDMHFLPSEASMKVSVASLQAQQGATFGSEVLGEWQQFMDPGIQYSSAMPTPSALPPSSNAVIPTHNPEASTGRPLTNMSSGLSYAPSSLASTPTQGVEKGGANAWATSSGLSLTVDPSKGGLALQGIASQCFAEFPSDPGFVERAARYSSFHNSGYGQQSPNKLSRTSSFRADSSANGADDAVKNVLDEGKLYSKLQKASQEAGLSPSKEDSLSSAPNSMEQGNRKRKAASEERSKDAATPIQKDSKNAESEEAKIKRQKGSEGSKDRDETKTKGEKSSSENSGSSSPKSKKDNPKPPEPPKQDYIHVRARRGQATDSHSLAERVRREKISERMKFLQDLVPGCSKVTGKAVMLDEIINYVQSLQRQVEFLSMKLAAVNPRLDINLDGLLTKEVLHGRGSPSPVVLNHDITTNYSHIQQQLQHAQQAVMQLGTSGLDLRSLGNSVENSLRTPVVNPDAFGDATSQASSVWDGELQSVVQMSFGVSPQGRPMTSQELQGHLPAGHMKVEN